METIELQEGQRAEKAMIANYGTPIDPFRHPKTVRKGTPRRLSVFGYPAEIDAMSIEKAT